jgi:hypothetical protein
MKEIVSVEQSAVICSGRAILWLIKSILTEPLVDTADGVAAGACRLVCVRPHWLCTTMQLSLTVPPQVDLMNWQQTPKPETMTHFPRFDFRSEKITEKSVRFELRTGRAVANHRSALGVAVVG